MAKVWMVKGTSYPVLIEEENLEANKGDKSFGNDEVAAWAYCRDINKDLAKGVFETYDNLLSKSKYAHHVCMEAHDRECQENNKKPTNVLVIFQEAGTEFEYVEVYIIPDEVEDVEKYENMLYKEYEKETRELIDSGKKQRSFASFLEERLEVAKVW